MDANSGCYTVPILVVVDSLFDLICDIKLVNGADGILDSLSPIFSPQRLEGTFRSKLPVCRRIFQASAQYFLSSSRAESREQRVVKRRYVPPSPFPAWHDSCHNRSKSYLMHPCNPLLKKKTYASTAGYVPSIAPALSSQSGNPARPQGTSWRGKTDQKPRSDAICNLITDCSPYPVLTAKHKLSYN